MFQIIKNHTTESDAWRVCVPNTSLNSSRFMKMSRAFHRNYFKDCEVGYVSTLMISLTSAFPIVVSLALNGRFISDHI